MDPDLAALLVRWRYQPDDPADTSQAAGCTYAPWQWFFNRALQRIALGG